MTSIQRIHEKILDHLVQLRESDKGLYFVPRRRNNKGRLDKGFWFLGDEKYMQVSFWDGGDRKEKIHNIAFAVFHDKTSRIVLCAEDSSDKARFLSKVAATLGGFKKVQARNKWIKVYPRTDYIQNLNGFLADVKPVVDRLLKTHKPKGIKILDEAFFNKYCQKVIIDRQRQIEIGNSKKVVKICWNTERWKRPSGHSGKSRSGHTHEARTGFGHEEWLFDRSKVVDGYHYAFLQPLMLKTDVHWGKIYNISLYTSNSLNKKYFVGRIENVECIGKEDSKRIYQIYNKKGWLAEMRSDVERVQADYDNFSKTKPEILFNVRFRFKDVYLQDELFELAGDDINITTNRYKLLPQKTEFSLAEEKEEAGNEGNMKNTSTRRRVFDIECEYDPYHDRMQNGIKMLLDGMKVRYGYKKVYIEKGRVDVKALTVRGTWHFYEIKTDNVKHSIRKALGQILEYSCFPTEQRAEKLYIVADEEPTDKVISYLRHIRALFGLPVFYRCYNPDEETLSEEY